VLVQGKTIEWGEKRTKNLSLHLQILSGTNTGKVFSTFRKYLFRGLCIYTHTLTHTHIYIHTYIYIYIYIYIYTHVFYIFIYMYINVYTHKFSHYSYLPVFPRKYGSSLSFSFSLSLSLSHTHTHTHTHISHCSYLLVFPRKYGSCRVPPGVHSQIIFCCDQVINTVSLSSRHSFFSVMHVFQRDNYY